MKKILFLGLCLTFFVNCIGAENIPEKKSPLSHESNQITVPIGGNSWVSGKHAEDPVSEKGFSNWTDKMDTLQTYVRFARPGKAIFSLHGLVPKGVAKLRVIVAGQSQDFETNGTEERDYLIGQWEIKQEGYVLLQVVGLSQTGGTFGSWSSWGISGPAVDEHTTFVKNNEGDYFYWGRRGPSVHLNYKIPESQDIEWFYNELTVPVGQDPLGSYFMADGFKEGYFGMQVNSEKERRILFSVWSPFKTDNPQSIPPEQRIVLLKKGEGVYTGEFGNEGAGGQSYLKYSWKAGNTYKFLLQGKPSGNNTTTYTAYFFAPEEGKWRIIASFQRPQTNTYLKSFHSFLENFLPEKGTQVRSVHFGNQWVADKSGNWTEINTATFTADATARIGYRMDYAGGTVQNQFFLKNCGFFNDFVPMKTSFSRNTAGKKPEIDLTKLP